VPVFSAQIVERCDNVRAYHLAVAVRSEAGAGSGGAAACGGMGRLMPPATNGSSLLANGDGGRTSRRRFCAGELLLPGSCGGCSTGWPCC
jgi:hypothetical protein